MLVKVHHQRLWSAAFEARTAAAKAPTVSVSGVSARAHGALEVCAYGCCMCAFQALRFKAPIARAVSRRFPGLRSPCTKSINNNLRASPHDLRPAAGNRSAAIRQTGSCGRPGGVARRCAFCAPCGRIDATARPLGNGCKAIWLTSIRFYASGGPPLWGNAPEHYA